ncbi:microfibril-associated glycoprotein 4-like [Drosophila innubila]|uniref:microfibril-associated glycoprotein 4-like n=1 Tax=Drosophila innubila TaxID=198719 RepID=UPI00148C3CDB|nr:microfibril-associated glycoprotein 4-like [Drosophila innubila]
MLQKIICIILVINSINSFTTAIHISEYNETNTVSLLRSQLTELRAEQGQELKILLSDMQFMKTELELLKKYINVVVSDNQCRAETEKQKKDITDRETKIRSLKADIQLLRTELENQKKSVLDQESNIQLLKTENQLLRVEHERNRKLLLPHNCAEAKSSGINEILLQKFSSQPFKVACDAETQGGGWTIILRRMDGSVNFYRNWTEYKNGFGDLDGEFFMGLDKVHEITAERRQELLVLLEDFEGNKTFEKYEKFAIGNEAQQYELHTLGDASGTADDSFSHHRGSKFSTFDRDNDSISDKNCAELRTGAWWYRSYGSCQLCQLTGTYGNNDYDKGVNWHHFRGSYYSLKKAVMMIRPRK